MQGFVRQQFFLFKYALRNNNLALRCNHFAGCEIVRDSLWLVAVPGTDDAKRNGEPPISIRLAVLCALGSTCIA